MGMDALDVGYGIARVNGTDRQDAVSPDNVITPAYLPRDDTGTRR